MWYFVLLMVWLYIDDRVLIFANVALVYYIEFTFSYLFYIDLYDMHD